MMALGSAAAGDGRRIEEPGASRAGGTSLQCRTRTSLRCDAASKGTAVQGQGATLGREKYPPPSAAGYPALLQSWRRRTPNGADDFARMQPISSLAAAIIMRITTRNRRFSEEIRRLSGFLSTHNRNSGEQVSEH